MAGEEGGASESLVKYGVPVLVAGKGRGKGKGTAADVVGRPLSKTEAVLNSILPPREWTKGGQLWVQHVSPSPSTRVDVISLQEALDHRLQQRQARETGICPIREELYAQCFDELIRQITVNCHERGLLLVRVREEIRETLAAYQTLYESSVAYGMRRALMAEQRKGELRAITATLEAERDDLEAQVATLEKKLEDMKAQEEEEAEARRAKHEEDAARLRETHDTLKASLEELLAPPKK